MLQPNTMSKELIIAPSILSADFAKLGEEIQHISNAGADWIHVDVMDGHFVPNLTIGPCVIKDIRKHSDKPFDVHLMINNPDQYINDFADSGADIITIHAEASTHLDRSVQAIKATGKKAGVSLVPSSPIDQLDYVLEQLDLILIMTVNPGFGGQSFITSQLKKIEDIAKRIDTLGLNTHIEVDGGINENTAKDVISAGANALVAGSAVFKGDPSQYKNNIEKLRG